MTPKTQNEEVSKAYEEQQETEQGAKQTEAPLTPVQIQEFIRQTHQFVTQLHLEQSAVLNVLLQRGLITTEELNEAYKTIAQDYQRQLEESRAGEVIPGASGVPIVQEQEIERQCGVDICGPSCKKGRKKPEAHGA